MKKEAMFYEKIGDNKVHCYLCPHQCRIPDSKFGVCGVRQNIDGRLYTHVYGTVIASHVDPIEKKPLYHFLPGSTAYSIATPGCNFQCGFCQNWQISQLSKRNGYSFNGQEVKPGEVVDAAQRYNCKSISYTYTEPTIFFEYAFDTAQLAKKTGLYNTFVTNGYMTKEALEAINPYLDAANVDLKSFREDFYRKICRARLQPVLETIRLMKKLGIWVEVTTLVIPGQNDSQEELTNIAKFIAEVGVDIPWHISRFHPDYKFDTSPSTPLETLKEAREIGEQQGLYYVYLGNVPAGGDTRCYKCGVVVIKRPYFGTEKNLLQDGKCPSCKTPVHGVWH
jgi:pyruvate formate lyase activating enzyme